MKKSTVIVFILVSIQLFSQDTLKIQRIKEFHVTLADISPLSIQLKYKKQISDKMYFKLGLINLSYNYSTNYNESSSFPIDNEAYSAGIRI